MLNRTIQDLPAARKASAEAQAKVKANTALIEFAIWNAKADQLKKCVDMSSNHLERVLFQRHLTAHLQSAIAKAQGAPHE